MRASILLVSTNLALPWISGELQEVVRGCGRAAVLTNASVRRPAQGMDARLAADALQRAGVAQVDLLHLPDDGLPPRDRFDCVCLAGGNPFHLVQGLRETGADEVLDELAAAGRPVLAAGLAACVLGRTLAHLHDFGLCVPTMGCREKVALGLLPCALLPSANRWRALRRNFAATLSSAEDRHGRVVTLDDDEALRFNALGESRIRPC